MSAANKAVMVRWFEEVWNNGREELIDELFAAEGIAHGLANETGGPIIGPRNYKPFYRSFRNAFPDVKIEITEIIAEGDIVALRCNVTGKHTGDGLGLEATHQPMEITGMVFTRLKDGQIVEAWNNFDFLTMFQMLGIVKMPVKF